MLVIYRKWAKQDERQVTKSFPQLQKRLSSAHGSCFTLSVFLCNKYLVRYYKWSSLLEARFSLLNAADLHGHYSFSLFLLAVASRSWLQKYMEKMNMRAITLLKQFTCMIFIYLQLLTHHLTGLLRTNTMTSFRLACWLSR